MNDTDDRSCTATATSLPKSSARLDVHIERIRPIEGEAALLGRAYILGVLHHAWFVQVEERDGQQIAVNDPYGRLDDFSRLDADAGPFQTIEVPGFPGEYALVIYPGGN